MREGWVVGVDSMWQNIVGTVFVIVWVGVGGVLFFRFRAKQRAYFRLFSPVDGVPLDMYMGGGPRSVTRAIFRVQLQPQSDPELERRRRELWRYYRHFAYWVFGFPALVVATVFVPLILTGVVR